MPGILTVSFEFDELLNLDKRLQGAAEKAAKDALRDISYMSLEHLKEEAQRNLRSSREIYLEALSIEELDGGEMYVISLDMKKAGWIEEGKKAGPMIPDFIKSGKIGWVKTSAEGFKYGVVPFKHNKGPASQTPQATDLTDAIKAELKKRKIPYAGIEKDANGAPKLGKLHSFNVSTPLKTRNGPGMGQGPIGAPRQGHTAIPYLQNVSIHQKQKGNKTIRSITTFRTWSEKFPDKWHHPGTTAKLFMDETVTWAQETFEKDVKPKILQSIMDGL